jgi:hypothetical protein
VIAKCDFWLNGPTFRARRSRTDAISGGSPDSRGTFWRSYRTLLLLPFLTLPSHESRRRRMPGDASLFCMARRRALSISFSASCLLVRFRGAPGLWIAVPADVERDASFDDTSTNGNTAMSFLDRKDSHKRNRRRSGQARSRARRNLLIPFRPGLSGLRNEPC